MARKRKQKSRLGLMAVFGVAVLIPFVASTFNSCDAFRRSKSETVTVATTPPVTPTPVPVPVPAPTPTPTPIPGLQNAWLALNNVNPPAARANHSAVWTGTRMIIWGGQNGSGYLGDGASLDPLTGNWTTISSVGAPSPRAGHKAVMINGKMIVWGGVNATNYYNDAYSYDPILNAWAPLTFGNQPAPRAYFSAVSTGASMLVWGGVSAVQATGFSDGGYYMPNTPWSLLSGADPILKRIAHAAIWTGNSMIMFGGINNNITSQDGFIFNPNTLVFEQLLITPGTPAARQEHSAAWDGLHMIVWGGLLNGITTSYYGDGGIFDYATKSWYAMNATGAPAARAGHSAVWAGDAMIIWGGLSGNPAVYYNSGGVFH